MGREGRCLPCILIAHSRPGSQLYMPLHLMQLLTSAYSPAYVGILLTQGFELEGELKKIVELSQIMNDKFMAFFRCF